VALVRWSRGNTRLRRIARMVPGSTDVAGQAAHAGAGRAEPLSGGSLMGDATGPAGRAKQFRLLTEPTRLGHPTAR
jgi:hypothetical protein